MALPTGSLPLGGVGKGFPFTEDETQRHFSYLSGTLKESARYIIKFILLYFRNYYFIFLSIFRIKCGLLISSASRVIFQWQLWWVLEFMPPKCSSHCFWCFSILITISSILNSFLMSSVHLWYMSLYPTAACRNIIFGHFQIFFNIVAWVPNIQICIIGLGLSLKCRNLSSLFNFTE